MQELKTNREPEKIKEREEVNISYVRDAVSNKLSNCVISSHMEIKSYKPIDIENIKDNEQVSILSDAMFRTMINNESRIQYANKLISLLLGEEPVALILIKSRVDK